MKNSEPFEISGNIVDVVNRRIFPGIIRIEKGKITGIDELKEPTDRFILPGLIDAHVHIESSMLIPSAFAKAAAIHGTVGVVSDPHEIANVLGLEGVRFMIENGKKVPFKFFFGAPSCVPATSFETSGTHLGPAEVEQMLDWKEIRYLSEMMNFPGVIYDDPDVGAKLKAAIKRNKVIDGHAPGLQGDDLQKYVQAGISTDHECFTLDEAREKAAAGMKILIREGSAARNFDTLLPILKEFPDLVMFCSDDKHPDDLIQGHINLLVAKAVQSGYDMMDVMRACTLNPLKHYGLDAGLLQPGDDADFVIVDSPESMNVKATFIKGVKVAENGKSLMADVDETPINRFVAEKLNPHELEVLAEGGTINVIGVIDGQIVTNHLTEEAIIQEGKAICDPENDLLKIVVINRYNPSPPAIGFVRGMGLKNGAIASTVAHDSHNIVAVGSNDELICEAVNKLIDSNGGIVACSGDHFLSLPLPVAGLMSVDDAYEVASKYQQLDKMAKQMGSKLSAPFMTLSFLSLLVIPALKLSDKGLFDGVNFKFVPLCQPL